MLNLIKADLYRVTRLRWLRGELAAYGLAATIPVLFLLASFVYALIAYPGQPISDGQQPFLLTLTMLYLSSRILPILATAGILQVAFSDTQNNYVRNLMSSLRGRLAYVSGKFLFAGVWAALMTLIALLISLLGLLIMRPALDAVFDGPASCLLWFVETWLAMWAFCALALVPALLTNLKPLSYLFAFMAVTGSIAGMLTMAADLLTVMLKAPAIMEGASMLISWFPSTLLNATATGIISLGTDALMSAGTMAPFLFPGGLATQTVLASVLWIVLSGAVTLALAARREA